MYTSVMKPVLRPSEAYARMAHKRVKRVPIDDLAGCVTAVLLTPYPPGIPLLIPGEMVNATIVSYLQATRRFNDQFPGFQTEIHGLVEEPNNRGTPARLLILSRNSKSRCSVSSPSKWLLSSA